MPELDTASTALLGHVGFDLAHAGEPVVVHAWKSNGKEFAGQRWDAAPTMSWESWEDIWEAINRYSVSELPWNRRAREQQMQGEIATILHDGGYISQHVRYRGWNGEWMAWAPPTAPAVPELVPPPPTPDPSPEEVALIGLRRHESIWDPFDWDDEQENLRERLNLRWHHGRPPAIPTRAQRAGVRE